MNESPAFNNQNFEIANNSASGSIVGTLAAQDPDQGQSLTYAIVSGNTSDAFSLESTPGILQVSNSSAINEATNPNFDLIVSVTDNGEPELSSNATIHIVVTTSNHAPQIQAQTFNVDENSPAGTFIGQINATDPDAGQVLTYSIPRGNSMSAFYIDENGALRVNNSNGINYERQSTFKLTVKVEDNGTPSLSGSAVITVRINDVNEAPAITEGQVFTFNEHMSAGTSIGAVEASDPDFNQTLSFSIAAGNTNEAFAINPTTGMLRIAGFVCYEYCSNYTLNIKVADNGTPAMSDEKQITINITDINEAPVIIDQAFEVNALSPEGTQIGTINASDPDLNQLLIFSIISGNSGNAFSLNSSTGELSVNNPEALNETLLSLTVEVKDNGEPSLSAFATVTITIVSINEAPVIENQTLNVPENSPSGFEVGQILASDADAGQTLSYSIVSGNTEGAFALTENGVLLVNKPEYIVYALNPLFNIEIKVTDNGFPELSDQAIITIQVLNDNNPPVMEPQSYSYRENAPNGRYICRFIATAANPGDKVQFYLLDGNTDNAFWLQAYTGRLFVKNTEALDFETNPVFNLNVRAKDNHGAFVDMIIPILLVDVNENPIVMDQTFNASRPQNAGAEVGIVEATDPDAGETLKYYITQGNVDNIFDIDNYTGLITIDNELAFNNSTNQSYQLRIRVRDNGYLSTYANVSISASKNQLAGEQNILPEMEGTTEITAFPNPSTSGIFHIKCTDFNNQEGMLTVLSLTGSIILQENIAGNSETLINLEAMPKGIYILRIVDGKNIYTKKLIRQ